MYLLIEKNTTTDRIFLSITFVIDFFENSSKELIERKHRALEVFFLHTSTFSKVIKPSQIAPRSNQNARLEGCYLLFYSSCIMRAFNTVKISTIILNETKQSMNATNFHPKVTNRQKEEAVSKVYLLKQPLSCNYSEIRRFSLIT